MLFCGILFFIPAVGQTVAPFIWFVFAGWMMAIQYADFPFDNHKISFKNMKNALAKRLGKNLTFGMLISFFTTLSYHQLHYYAGCCVRCDSILGGYL